MPQPVRGQGEAGPPTAQTAMRLRGMFCDEAGRPLRVRGGQGSLRQRPAKETRGAQGNHKRIETWTMMHFKDKQPKMLTR